MILLNKCPHNYEEGTQPLLITTQIKNKNKLAHRNLNISWLEILISVSLDKELKHRKYHIVKIIFVINAYSYNYFDKQKHWIRKKKKRRGGKRLMLTRRHMTLF